MTEIEYRAVVCVMGDGSERYHVESRLLLLDSWTEWKPISQYYQLIKCIPNSVEELLEYVRALRAAHVDAKIRNTVVSSRILTGE